MRDFLEFGCNVTCFVDDGLIRAGDDLMVKAEEGLAADVLVLLLSPSSCRQRWPRERWEPVLFEETRRLKVELVTILLGACPFPPLLSRRNFFDATACPLTAMRLVKRWFWLTDHKTGFTPSAVFSRDLEELYASLADQAGAREVSGAIASRFAREADQQFEAVLWVPCHGRNRTQIIGELGSQLGLALDGSVDENGAKIQDLLAHRRCLLVLDAPAPEIANHLVPHSGRTSTLVTRDPVTVLETPDSLPYARDLVAARRYAEAYELLYRLLDSGIAPETCARELTWICDCWDRIEEANSLRFLYGPKPHEQLLLF